MKLLKLFIEFTLQLPIVRLDQDFLDPLTYIASETKNPISEFFNAVLIVFNFLRVGFFRGQRPQDIFIRISSFHAVL